MRNNKDFFQRAKKVTKRTIFASWDSRGENLFCIRSGSTPYYLNVRIFPQYFVALIGNCNFLDKQRNSFSMQ